MFGRFGVFLMLGDRARRLLFAVSDMVRTGERDQVGREGRQEDERSDNAATPPPPTPLCPSTHSDSQFIGALRDRPGSSKLLHLEAHVR